jgi:hypothetical protein
MADGLYPSTIFGFHGCKLSVAKKLIAGEDFKPSNKDYDWLGPGVYFWEANPRRALEFASEKRVRDGRDRATRWAPRERPAALGAYVELGRCLDLTTKNGLDLLRTAFQSLELDHRRRSKPLPVNAQSMLLRYLDCAVVQRLHSMLQWAGIEPYQTVRGAFAEGKPVYPGTDIREKTHIQVAVLDLDCIKGAFNIHPRYLK